MGDQRGGVESTKSVAVCVGDEQEVSDNDDVDDVVEAIIKCQSSRINDQRTVLPERNETTNLSEMDEEFFQFLSKMQGDRFDEQRASLALKNNSSSEKQVENAQEEIKEDEEKSSSK